MNVVLLIVLATLCCSYGWAIRGSIMGGQKGAMLPGALLGFALAYLSGNQVIIDNFWIPAAVGAGAMFFGGTQTYGQTLGMSADRNNKRRHLLGRAGTFVKGASWFGAFCGLEAVCFAAMAGKFSVLQLCLFVAFLPVFTILGFFVLNWPQKPKEGKFPKLYFSEGRTETWGGIFFVSVEIILFGAVTMNWFIVEMTLAGLITGGLGFFLGNGLQNVLYVKAKDNPFISPWKAMEISFGAIGGLGSALSFYFAYKNSGLNDITAIWRPLSDKSTLICNIVWAVLFVFYVIIMLLKEPKPYLPAIQAKFKSGQISEAQFLKLKKNAQSDGEQIFRRNIKFFGDEIYHWIVLSYLPMLFTMLGNELLARLTICFIIFWVTAEKLLTSDKNRDIKFKKTFNVFLVVVTVAVLVLQLLGYLAPTAMAYILLMAFIHEVVEFVLDFSPYRLKKIKAEKCKDTTLARALGANITVRITCVVELIIIIALVAVIC